LEAQARDDQIKRDFAPGGLGERLIAKVEAAIAAGKFISLEEGLRARREQRAKQ